MIFAPRLGVLRSCRPGTAAVSAIVLVAAAFSPPAAPAQSPVDRSPAGLEAGVDPGIRPGDDFFGFANGAWLRTTTIPAGMDHWGARNDIDTLTRRQLAALLDDAARAPAGSLARAVADFRAAYLDTAAIEAAGLRPLRPALDSIDQVRDKAGLARLLGAGTRADVDPLNWGIYRSSAVLGLAVEQGLGGEPTYLPFLVQGGLGLPRREDYLGADAAMQALRARYRDHIARTLELTGRDRAGERADAVLALETALARSEATADASADDRNASHHWSRSDFERLAPGMDWDAFLAAAGLAGKADIIAWQPGALAGVAAQVEARPLEVWKDYLRIHLIDHYADVLPRPFAEPATASRTDRALASTEAHLGDGVGRLYAERYFPPAEKARVQAIVANVVAAFTERVRATGWMSPATRAQALVKVRTLYVGVGYPDAWPDESDLRVDPRDALGNIRRAEARAYRQALARLGRPVDRADWIMLPQQVGAILSFQQNAYDFAAALLQPPKYDPAASDAASYGAIGAIIGHDVTHYVDRLGADYDTTGAKRRWWTPEDSSRFEAVAAPLVAQFSAYQPLPGLSLDGARTETEDVADLGGLVAAFDAYRRTLGDRVSDTAYVRRQDRQFFLAFARSWRSTLSDGALRTQVTSGDHAPDRYRVSVVRNLDAWYQAFDVRPGDKLYLPPEARVRVW